MISIVGATATGKTQLALDVAAAALARGSYSGVDIISADSRQVFAQLEIITGADVPQGFEMREFDKYPRAFFQSQDGATRLHGVGIIEVDQEWSVAHFLKLYSDIVATSLHTNSLPIVVGGTGLYHVLAAAGIMPEFPKRDEDLREKYKDATLQELQSELAALAPEVFESLNNSDRHNPVRLLRKLELVALGETDFLAPSQLKLAKDHQLYGLRIEREVLRERIQKRVEARLSQGAVGQAVAAKNLLNQSGILDSQALSSMGVKECLELAAGTISEDECVKRWTQAEFSYAKRQETWWQKYPVEWVGALDEQERSRLVAKMVY